MEKMKKDMERSFKKIKLRKTLKIIGIAVVSAVVVFIALGFGLQYYSSHISKNYWKTVEISEAYNSLQSPNVFVRNQIEVPYGAFGKAVHSDTYKNIDGYPVAWVPQDWTRGLSPIYESEAISFHGDNAYMDKTSQKLAIFFLTNADTNSKNFAWLKPTHQASQIATVKDSLAEVAVTFDKPYSYAEIQKMIPSNLLINWYWLGNGNRAGIPANYGIPSEMVNSASDQTPTGQLTGKISSEQYKNYVETYKRSNWPLITKVNNISYIPAALGKQLPENLNDAKFSGVILTGRTQNFANLDKENWVFASNVGLTHALMPYDKPTK